MNTGNFVAYHRVSTTRQGVSGLGLEAQVKAVDDYLNGGDWILIKTFTEVESGKHSDRPELAKALEACRRHKATLVIAKLDRLARNVAFISGLMEAKVDFVAADMPEANEFTVHIMAAMAQHEGRQISARTKAALAAAKARGTKLGWAMDSRKHEQRGAAAKGVIVRKLKADRHAANVLPIIRDIQNAGVTTLKGIANALNARGIKTARDSRWYATTVKNVMQRQLDKAA